MIRSLLVFIIFAFSTAAHAYDMRDLLNSPQMSKLITKLSVQGYQLGRVDDVYAQSATRPLCLCEAYEIHFTRFDEFGKMSVEGYNAKVGLLIENGKVKDADLKITRQIKE